MEFIKKPILAATLDNIEFLEKSKKYPVYVTEKIDGIRALKLSDKLVSRTLKPIRNDRIKTILEKLLPNGSDGEIFIKGTFQDLTSAVMKTSSSALFETKFVYYWFDFVKDDASKPYLKRIQDMKDYITLNPEILLDNQATIIPLFPKEINNVEELLLYEKQVLEKNFEGVMIRSGKSKYKNGRSTINETFLLKMKRFADAEAIVVGFEELLSNTNEASKDERGESKRSSKKEGMVKKETLGSFKVSSLDETMFFKIGTGFSASQRQEFWNQKESLVGKIVKYKYFEIGIKDSPRFPVFLGFRDIDDM